MSFVSSSVHCGGIGGVVTVMVVEQVAVAPDAEVTVAV